MNKYYHTRLGREKAREEKLKKEARPLSLAHSSAVLMVRVVAAQSSVLSTKNQRSFFALDQK